MSAIRSLLRWLWNVVRDPALYVIAFTFYAGMNRWIGPAQLALCYLGTVLVIVVTQLLQDRKSERFDFLDELRTGVAWGSLLFVIGFAWGATCGYILEWMKR